MQRTYRKDPFGQIGMLVPLRVDDAPPAAEFAPLSLEEGRAYV